MAHSSLNDAAVALLEAGRAREAASAFRRAIQLAPNRHDAAAAYFNLGIAFKDQSRHFDSVVAYLEALTLRPAFPQAHFNLARSFQILADDPSPHGLLRHHARRRDALLRAARHFATAAAASPSRPDGSRGLEEVLTQLGEPARASAAYAAFLRASPREGVPPRRGVPCARLRQVLSQRREEASGEAEAPPPRSICRPRTRADAAAAARFAARGYAVLPPPLEAEALAYVAEHYAARLREGSGGGRESFYREERSARDREYDSILAKDRWALDNDELGLFLAERLAPLVRSYTGVCVKPAFVKAAWYEAGAKLPLHRDQVLNLFSISLILSSTPAGAASSAWPLHLIGPPNADGTPNHEVNLTAPVGGALLFRGRDFVHERPCCLGGGESSLVLLLHYVPHAWPEVACTLRLDPKAVDGLRHECTPRPPAAACAPPPGDDDACPEAEGGEAEDERGRWRCDPQAHAWLGPLHEEEAGGEGASSAAASVAAAAGPRGRFLLYSPCVASPREAGYCLGQWNNQLFQLHHALAVARALQRTLVVPPFVWMATQDGEQRWYAASHFLDLCVLRRRQPIIELADFSAMVSNASNGFLSHFLYPPYLLDGRDPTAFQGNFFRRHGLRFLQPRRMSPFAEVVQATGGRGDEPYSEGEGLAYWRAVALLIGKQQGEHAELHAQLYPEWFSPVRQSDGQPGGGVAEGLGGEREAVGLEREAVGREKERSLVGRHSAELAQWRPIAGRHPELKGEPLLDPALLRAGVPDVLALDFAPSYNFHVDRFAFDKELRVVHRYTRFTPRLQQGAEEAARLTFGGAPYLAVHLRRDGYERYCHGASSGLSHYKWRRFGVHVSAEACFPSVSSVAAAVRAALQRHGLRRVLLATNSQDADELAKLQALVPFSRWQPAEMSRTHPEWIPSVELLLCARAKAFIGTLPSTWSASVLIQRDLLHLGRNTTSFFGGFSPDSLTGSEAQRST
ncbi:hypothetical protein AB1Y20_018289 [Prymnesium parvum]|uniref:GDP-fucose protein O-fucosyltransferase 2 n=1 Tax=Prymnesium parvum TaxID=97485 RepID=A0AB34JRU0_PRYPA